MKLFIEGACGNNAANGKFETAYWVYAEGKLEEMAGRDIVGHLANEIFDYKNDRVEDVIAVLPNGREIKAKLFFWNAQGRVVAANDKEAIEQVISKMDESCNTEDDEPGWEYCSLFTEYHQCGDSSDCPCLGCPLHK